MAPLPKVAPRKSRGLALSPPPASATDGVHTRQELRPMYIVGEEEIEAIARVIRSGKLFRYGEEGQCATFEKRYAAYLGVDHFALSASGTFGLVAGLTGMGVGPGDEVIIPAHTY